MIPGVATRRARLEALLLRVQTNRARLGHPAALRPAPPPVEDEEPLTTELPGRPSMAEPPARTIPGRPPDATEVPVAASAVWEGEDEDVEMEIVGEASSEEMLIETPGPAAVEPLPPPPLPSTTVSPAAAAPAAPPAEALPASVRFESPPPLDNSPIVVVGAVAPAAPPTIGALLRASIKPFGTS